MPVSGIFPYIGADPVTDFLKPLGVLDEQGYMLVDESMETSVPLLYGAGDVCQKVLRQVVTAANDGAVAAQDAFHKIKLPTTEHALQRPFSKLHTQLVLCIQWIFIGQFFYDFLCFLFTASVFYHNGNSFCNLIHILFVHTS